MRGVGFIYVFLLLLIFQSSFAQLNDFNLEVVKTDETCLGNATLTFNTTDTNPLASLLYTVYKYPNLALPVSVSTTPFLGSLSSGDYKIRVVQSLNNLSNLQETDITIIQNIQPLTYSITPSSQNCSQGGTIEIEALTGIAAEYEIISGPETRPLQESPIFTSLEGGTYNIRVFDICGEALVTTYTLQLSNTGLSLSGPEFDTGPVPDCTEINVINTLTAPQGVAISYPVTADYTIYLPDGTQQLVTQVFNDGPQDILEITQLFTVFGSTAYTYDLSITDNCNTAYQLNNQVFNPAPSVGYRLLDAACGMKYLELSIANALPPFTINFVNPPTGFDVSSFNALHPGPFTDTTVVYGGETNPLPEGTYQVEVTDSCGRTGTESVIIIYDTPVPLAQGRNNGCFSELGRITVSIPNRTIVSATVMSAPPDYGPTPDDVSGSINQGRVILNNVPIGDYQLDVIDECGILYTVQVNVPAFVERNFSATSSPDCSPGFGSVTVRSLNGGLTQLFIIDAPEEFDEELPFDVSSNISAGTFYIGSLPAGAYTFEGTDVCGIEKTISRVISGYVPDPTSFTYMPNCGSFDIELSDSSISSSAAYWFQKLDPDTGIWRHPVTGAAYTEGDVPTDTTAIALQNNSTTYNLNYSGVFRILKNFTGFGNGSEQKECIEVLGEFEYDLALKIANAYKLTCGNNADDVYIDAVRGLQPYTFSITKKDGADFFIDNGANNIFSGLQPGVYQFVVQDACGNRSASILNISLLPALVVAGQPQDLRTCSGDGIFTNKQFTLTDQDNAILNGQSPDLYTITYHLSQEDADNDTGALPAVYNNLVNNQVIYARIVHNSITICHEVVSFRLVVEENPVLAMPLEYYICDNGTVDIVADSGFDSYTWSTGEIGEVITIGTPGTYTLTIENARCSSTVEFTVVSSGRPVIKEIEPQDWTNNENTITVFVEGTGDYQYSLDNSIYQSANIFTGLTTGFYTVYVKDTNGCGLASKEVALLNYPKFFTPNQDGHNEMWRIKYSIYEPTMQVYIYDRYGKLITGFDGMSQGWDGTLNGLPLPSSDYWFVAERADGRVFKGHFSMIR